MENREKLFTKIENCGCEFTHQTFDLGNNEISEQLYLDYPNVKCSHIKEVSK